MSNQIILIFCFIFGQINQVLGKIGIGLGEQDWGYVTVRPNAHLFWWLYYVNSPESIIDVYSKPLLIWLEGGPGASGTGAGNFLEIGPLDTNLQRRNYTFVNDYNVLFIDSPVGTGFSYVENESAYTKNNLQIADDLFECVKKFLELIPAFRNVSTYIIGESYGPKMGVQLASIWYKNQQSKSIQSNLRGIVMGAPFISPADLAMYWAPCLFNAGIIDSMRFEQIESEAAKFVQAVKKEQFRGATDIWKVTTEAIGKLSDDYTIFNVLYWGKSREGVKNYTTRFPRPHEAVMQPAENLTKFMNEVVKQTLGLHSDWKKSSKVFDNLHNDIMKPVTNVVEELLNDTNLKISVYAGQLDAFISLPATINWVEKLNWKHSAAWKNAMRIQFAVDGIVEGYVKSYKKFKMYWVSRAGHSVAAQNPYAVNAILQDITSLKHKRLN